MRTKEQITKTLSDNNHGYDGDAEYEIAWNSRLIVELLLDIRELLENKTNETINHK